MTSLADGQYQTPMEVALERACGFRISALAAALGRLWDPATVPASMLPWLAQTVDADLWPGAIGGEALQRLAIQDAHYIHRHRGTAAALQRFAQRAQFTVSWELHDRVGTTPAGITVFVNPGAPGVATLLWVEYVTRVIGRLVPGWLILVAVHVLQAGRETGYTAGAGSAWERQILTGTISEG